VQLPADTPVTTPVELTVATEGLLLVHVPPGVESCSDTDECAHVPDGPVIGDTPVVPITVNEVVR